MNCTIHTQDQYTLQLHKTAVRCGNSKREETESDVMVFATEDEQEARTEQMSSVWYDKRRGAKTSKGALYLFMVPANRYLAFFSP